MNIFSISSCALGVADVLELGIPLLELVNGLLALFCSFSHLADAISSLLDCDSTSDSDISVIDHACVVSLLEVLVLFVPLFVFDSLILEEVLNVEECFLVAVNLLRTVIAGEERLECSIPLSLSQSISRRLSAVIAESEGGRAGASTETSRGSMFSRSGFHR